MNKYNVYNVGDKVSHTTYGTGTVEKIEKRTIVLGKNNIEDCDLVDVRFTETDSVKHFTSFGLVQHDNLKDWRELEN